MNFHAAFVATDNATEVCHPGGIKFRLLSHGHADAWATLMAKYPLAKIQKLNKLMAEGGTDNLEIISKHYDTFEEYMEAEAAMVAAHIVNWSDMEDENHVEIPHSFAKACELAVNFKPFREWVAGETRRLAEEEAAKQEAVDEEVKKN